MKKFNIFRYLLYSGCLIVLFSACQKNDSKPSNNVEAKNINGYAQKGPFVNGSSVTIYDLQSDLSPTGKSFSSTITDNNGSFIFDKIPLSSPYISLKAEGFYFNEVLGRESSAQITLYALTDFVEYPSSINSRMSSPEFTSKGDININMVTTLEKERVKYLVAHGKSFNQAKKQAEKEILAIFNIEKKDIKSSETLNISQDGDDNAILLAISCILQGYRSESKLTALLSNISTDIKKDGTLDHSEWGSQLINQAVFLDAAAIKQNLEEKYDEIGVSRNIPDFGKYIENFIAKTKFQTTGSIFDYPKEGMYGDNILYLKRKTLDSGDLYSLAADIPKGISLKITITALSNVDIYSRIGVWLYEGGTPVNWNISDVDRTTHTQTFKSIESGKSCDLKILFTDGTYSIKYYEKGFNQPTFEKTITVN